MVKIGKLLGLGARNNLIRLNVAFRSAKGRPFAERKATNEAIRANRSDVRFGRETSRTIAIRQTACGGQSAHRTRTGLAAGEGLDVPMKTVFTTGEAAKICKVSQQTIIRCF